MSGPRTEHGARLKLFREAFKDAADEADFWKAECARLAEEIYYMCQALARIRDSAGQVSYTEIEEIADDALVHEVPRGS